MPVAIGVEAELQLPRARDLIAPAIWGTGSSAHAALASLMLHLPAYEVRNASEELVDAYLKGYALVLKDIPLDVLQDACKTALSWVPAFQKMPTPAQLLEIIEKRRIYWGRVNRLAILERIAELKREDPRPRAPEETPEEIQERFDRLLKRGKYATRRAPGDEGKDESGFDVQE